MEAINPTSQELEAHLKMRQLEMLRQCVLWVNSDLATFRQNIRSEYQQIVGDV
jgi:hypothetical protein